MHRLERGLRLPVRFRSGIPHAAESPELRFGPVSLGALLRKLVGLDALLLGRHETGRGRTGLADLLTRLLLSLPGVLETVLSLPQLLRGRF